MRVLCVLVAIGFVCLPSPLVAIQNQDPAEITALLNKADEYHKADKDSLAAETATRALNICRTSFGNDHVQTAEALYYVGKYSFSIGEDLKAIDYLLESVKIYEKKAGANAKGLVLSYSQLAAITSMRSEYASAITYLRRALAIQEKALGGESSEVGNIAYFLAMNLALIDQLDEAYQLYDRVLDIRLKNNGIDSDEVVEVVERLCLIAMRQQVYGPAKEYGLKALEIQNRLHGIENVKAADLIVSLALIASREENYGFAKETFAKGEEIYRRILKPDDIHIAVVLLHRAQVHRLEGDYKTAKDLFSQAATIYGKSYGEDQSTTAEALYGVAESAFLGMEYVEAVEACDRARRITREYMAKNLPFLPESEQLEFIDNQDAYRMDEILSAARMLSAMPDVNKKSASWVLNSQGVAQESLTEQNRRLNQLSASEDKAKVKKLNFLRQQIAQASLHEKSANKKPLAEEEIGKMRDEVAELTKQLAISFGREEAEDHWVELDAVQRSIDQDSVILQFARYNEFDFATGSASGVYRYIVWVIPPKGNVQLIDLGPAEPIDQAIDKVRERIADANKPNGSLKRLGEEASTIELRALLKNLKTLTLSPVEKHISKAKKLWICPDGSLWLSPWAALPSGNTNEFLIEKFDVQFLISPRSLVEKTKQNQSTQPPVIFANPRFDLSPASVWKSISEVAARLGIEAPTELERQRSFKRATLRPFANVLPLPNTELEAAMISPSLKLLTGEEPIKFLDQQALESAARSIKQPKVLVFGTHGFLFSDEPPKPGDASANKNDITNDRNPLARCGLLLAGCKDPNAGKSTGGDDGVLTGMEIAGMNLMGTQLVILSACETGVGKVRNGEGIASLCQAFQLAGAETVVATLWSVPDRDSALLVNKFAESLAKGNSTSTAMREAQIDRIEKRRERYGDAHPFFWSAFTVTGR